MLSKLESLLLSFFHQFFTLMSISLSFQTEEALFTALIIYTLRMTDFSI